MPNEPGQAILTIFSQLIDRVKSTRPIRTDGKSLTTGFVYSQLPLGMMVDPDDYSRPWTPMGGSTLQDTVAAQPTPPATPPAGGDGAAGGGTPPRPAPDPKFRKAMEAAFKSAQLVDHMIMVTDDDAYLEYPAGGRHLSFAYDGIVHGMQALPTPSVTPEVQARIDAARKVLYEQDDEGNIVGKSKLYKNYLQNATAYAQAKKAYADAQAATLNDPTKADTWPMDSVTFQNAVDEAFDSWKTEGAEKVEQALDTIEAVGVNMQEHMIAKARKVLDAWNLGLAGVPTTIPYSYLNPTSWCELDDDRIGWQKLTVSRGEYHHTDEAHTTSSSHFFGQQDASHTAAGGGVSFLCVTVGGHGESNSWSNSYQSNYQVDNSTQFHNTAKDLTIELEYGMVTIERPWLVSDLLYMRNWYMVGQPKNSVSDGTVGNQVRTDKPLLPMIPEQMLVIRNVRISSQDWGSDGESMDHIYGNTSSSSSGSSSGGGGAGGVTLGFVNFVGGGDHTESHGEQSGDSQYVHDHRDHYGISWDGSTLEVKGAQIIAWLSTIVPACPPLDDPGLKLNQPQAQPQDQPAAPHA